MKCTCMKRLHNGSVWLMDDIESVIRDKTRQSSLLAVRKFHE